MAPKIMYEDDLADKLKVVLQELSDVMKARKDQIEDIRSQITVLENQNEDLERKVTELMRDFLNMNWWIEEYKKYHAEQSTNYPGNNLKPQLIHVKDLVQDTKSKTLLDYGCGKGLQYTKWKHHEELGIDMPALYDPAVPVLRYVTRRAI